MTAPLSDKQRRERGDQVVDKIHHLLESFDQRITLNNLRLAERYIKSEIHVLVDFMVEGINEQFIAYLQRAQAVGGPEVERRDDNVLSPVGRARPHEILHHRPDINASEGGADGQQQAVLVDIVKFVELPDRIVPTLVRFGCVDCIESVLPRSLYFSISEVWVFRGVVGDRILDFPGSCGYRADADPNGLVGDVVEGSPKILQHVPRDGCDGQRCRVHSANIVNALSCLRIILGPDFIWPGINKSAHGRLKVLDVSFGPFNFRPTPVEGIRHEQ